MPPQSPVDASPIPRARGSNGPKVTVGPGGQRFANRKPWRLGRKPGTAAEPMPTSYVPGAPPAAPLPGPPHRIPGPPAAGGADPIAYGAIALQWSDHFR